MEVKVEVGAAVEKCTWDRRPDVTCKWAGFVHSRSQVDSVTFNHPIELVMIEYSDRRWTGSRDTRLIRIFANVHGGFDTRNQPSSRAPLAKCYIHRLVPRQSASNKKAISTKSRAQYVRLNGGTALHSASSRVWACTARKPCCTLPCGSFCHVKLCFIHSVSSRSGKSSRACAPRDSLRFAAASVV